MIKKWDNWIRLAIKEIRAKKDKQLMTNKMKNMKTMISILDNNNKEILNFKIKNSRNSLLYQIILKIIKRIKIKTIFQIITKLKL